MRGETYAYWYLRRHGYRVIPVNPRESEILGEKSFASLLDVPVHIDVVNVFRAPDAVPVLKAGLVDTMAMVSVGPPLSASGPSRGSTPVRSPGARVIAVRSRLPIILWPREFTPPFMSAPHLRAVFPATTVLPILRLEPPLPMPPR